MSFYNEFESLLEKRAVKEFFLWFNVMKL